MRNSLQQQSNLQWIRRTRVEQMVKWVKSHRYFERFVMLFLFAYCFLLRWAITSLTFVACRHSWLCLSRLPSEGLPVLVSDAEVVAEDGEVSKVIVKVHAFRL